MGHHADHPVEAFGTYPHLQPAPQVQGLFLQVQGQGAVCLQADMAMFKGVGKAQVRGGWPAGDPAP